MRRIALLSAAVLAISLLAWAASVSARRQASATTLMLHVTFNGAGRGRRICPKQQNCIAASDAGGWRREWNVPLQPNGTFPRSEPSSTSFGIFSNETTWKPGYGPNCDVTHTDITKQQLVGADNDLGQLRITTGVPMTDGAAEPNGTPGCIVPAVAGAAAQITTPAAHSVTNTRAWFGKYEQWTRGHGATSQLVQGAWTGASTYGTNTIDWVGALSVCEGGCVEAPLHEEIDAWLRVAMEVLGKYANLKTPPPVDSPETGWLNGEIFLIADLRTASVVNGVRQATGRLATIHQYVAKDRSTILRPSYTASELTTLAKLKGSATFSGSLTFTPAQGKRVSVSLRFKLKPAAPEAAATPTPRPGGTITSVRFFGSAANPSVVVQGKNLGAKPAPDPAFHPSGHSGCPSVTGDSGYDYGTSLYLANTTKNWAAGRSRPSLGELDCLDLVVTKFTSSEVAFHFGPFYAQYEKAKLDAGDAVQIVVNDSSKTVTAKYSAAASG